MTYSEAYAAWKDGILPMVIETYGDDDKIAQSESWNDYTDGLCKDGELTDLQYHHCPAHDDDIPEDVSDEREYILKAMGVRLEWSERGSRPDNLNEWPAGSRHFRTSIIRGSGAVLSAFYSQGPAVGGVPNLEDVLSALLMDTCGLYGGIEFEEWADDLGLDSDSRKAERVFNQVCETMRGLEGMFGVNELEGLRALFEDF